MSRFILLAALALSLLTNVNAIPAELIPRKQNCIIKSYADAPNASGCTHIIINGQTVPSGKCLALSGLRDGTTVTLTGDLVFTPGKKSADILFSLDGGKISFNGNGYTIDGKGSYYWDGKGLNGGVPKPKYTVSIKHSGTFSNVSVKNVPGHAIRVQNPSALTISSVLYDNSAGALLGHNTDGFDVSSSTNLTITGCTIINQDDCIAINDATNIVFKENTCSNGHGISIGSIKSGHVVNGVTISNNKIMYSQQGLRIKTYAGASHGSVSGVNYTDNTVTGATKYGVVIVQDYTNDGETGKPTGGIPITNVLFQGTNYVSTLSSATMVKVLCAGGACKGRWDWSGLRTSGGKKGSNQGGAPITGYKF